MQIDTRSFQDALSFIEQSSLSGAKLRGRLSGHDPETGELLWVRENLVVRLGREFGLRKIFSLPYPEDLNNLSNLHARSVCLFGLGSGGTPAGDPFNPISPTPADKDLNNKLPFRITTPSAPLSDLDVPKYADGVEQADGTFFWFKKTFLDTPILTIDDASDEAFVTFILPIEKTDVRDMHVNELSLYSAKQSLNAGATVFSDFKIFSRITFDTEPFTSISGKAQNVHYSIYA